MVVFVTVNSRSDYYIWGRCLLELKVLWQNDGCVHLADEL